MNAQGQNNTLLLFFLYLTCTIMVVVFVNMYGLFSFLNKTLGTPFISYAPLIIPALAVTLLLIFFYRKTRRNDLSIQWIWILTGLAVLFFALLIPDRTIPIKRIHVTEYALLSLVVRYIMSHRHSGLYLLTYSILFTSILGIHDEFLQGIHSQRTYGLRDMAVNGCAAIGASFLWHGLQLFAAKRTKTEDKEHIHLTEVTYLIFLAFALLAVALPLTVYLMQAMPLWPFLPLSSAMVYWSCFIYNRPALSTSHHGITAITIVSSLFLIYPVIVNVLKITFH